MTLKPPNWQPKQPLPRYADRKTLAAIITHNFFPISHRTLQTWPLTVRRPNRAAVYEVAEALELAEKNWKAQSLINGGVGDMVKALNTPPSKNLRGAAVKAPISQRERDDNYNRVIVQLAPRWRVIVCKDSIQWIQQRKEASHAGP